MRRYPTMQARLHRLSQRVLVVAVCAQSLPASAHGIELFTPFVVWPALVFGLLGGAYSGSRSIRRQSGMVSVLGISLAVVAVVAVFSAVSEITESGVTVLFQALVEPAASLVLKRAFAGNA